MTAFLEQILPTNGTYCALGIKGKGDIRTSFATSLEEIQQIGEDHDKAGVDAYFALASFNDAALGRKQSNISHLRSLFIELDCGHGKPYEDRATALEALVSFVKSAGLPRPVVVASGGGIHVYWPLTENISYAEWLPIAKALKAKCLDSGLHIDPVVTADGARVLRIPGTNNFKQSTPRPVQLIVQGKSQVLSRITQCLPNIQAPLIDFSSAKAFGGDSVTDDIVGTEFPSSSFARILRKSTLGVGCAQITFMVGNAATLDEPLWRAGLSIAQHCSDRETAITAVSAGHEGYVEAQARAKAERIAGPYTCEWFKSNYPANCAGCKHQLTSPILLGREVLESPADENGAYIVDTTIAPISEDAEATVVQVAIPKYPFPYFRGASGGVYMRNKDKDTGELEEIEIYPYDLYLTSRFCDLDTEGAGDGEMVGINLHLPHDGVRRFHAPLTGLFAKDSLRDVLVKHGAIAYGPQLDKIMNYFGLTIRQLQAQHAAHRTRTQMGWTPDMQGFVVGELEYTAAGAKLAPPASGTRQLAAHFQQLGTATEWSEVANFYTRPGMEAHALTVCFGFGSPILKLVSSGNVKGALISLMSNESGTGKTTAQMLVNSIFGHPSDLLMLEKDSLASKYHRLGMMNSIASTVDEITNMTDSDLSDFIYGTTSGRGKHRMEAQTNKLRVNNTTWCNITIASGNSSNVDKLAQFKSTADGELRRVIEIYVSPQDDTQKADADAVFGKLPQNYGVAGPLFISYVLANKDYVIDLVKQIQGRIDTRLGLKSADRYYSIILACGIAGGFIAKHLGLIAYDMGALLTYGISLVGQNKAVATRATGSPATIAQEALTSYINENINSVLVINSMGRGGIPSAPIREVKGNQLKVRYEPDRQELFVVSGDFKRYLHSKQIDVQRSIQALVTQGLMKNGGEEKSKRIAAGALSGVPSLPTRCFCFDGAAIGLDQTVFSSDGTEDSITV